jgi:hypothetical protein
MIVVVSRKPFGFAANSSVKHGSCHGCRRTACQGATFKLERKAVSCVPVLGQSFPRSNELFVTNFHVIQLEKLKTWVSRSRWKMYNLRRLLPATDPRSKQRKGSRYEAGKRSGAWIKIKLHQEQEFVIGGYTEPEGGRKYFGALLVGFYEGEKLKFVGRVGTGFSEKAPARSLR